MSVLIQNKKAFHDFEIIEKFEAGIVLKGSEVKALRAGKGNLKDSFVRIIKGEMFLLNMHISCLATTNSYFRHEEKSPRKLLMHKKQIDKLFGHVSQGGMTIVALNMYFNKSNKLKVQIALAKGKNLHDKRETLKKKQADLEARRAMTQYK